ncbi:hypothetical protein LXL04_015773 [Taraxacum kok-saghyz]
MLRKNDVLLNKGENVRRKKSLSLNRLKNQWLKERKKKNSMRAIQKRIIINPEGSSSIPKPIYTKAETLATVKGKTVASKAENPMITADEELARKLVLEERRNASALRESDLIRKAENRLWSAWTRKQISKAAIPPAGVDWLGKR